MIKGLTQGHIANKWWSEPTRLSDSRACVLHQWALLYVTWKEHKETVPWTSLHFNSTQNKELARYIFTLSAVIL